MLQLNKKKQDYFIDLFDGVLDEDNPFNNTMKTEDTFIDNLFDDTDQKEKNSEDVLQDMNIDQNKLLFVDLPEEWPEKVKIAPDQDEVLFVDLPEELQEKVKKKTPKITPKCTFGSSCNQNFKKISETKTKRTLEKCK